MKYKILFLIFFIGFIISFAYIIFRKPEKEIVFEKFNNDSLNLVQDSFKIVNSNLQNQIIIIQQTSQKEINEILKKYSFYTKLDTRRKLEKFKSEYDSIERHNLRSN